MGKVLKVFIAAALAGLAAFIWWNGQRTREDAGKAAGASAWKAVMKDLAFDPSRVRANIVAQINQRAIKEIARLHTARDSQEIAVLEKTRDQQLADTDRLLEQIARAFEKKEATADYATACRILAEQEPKDALRFLESKKATRDAKLEVLKRGIHVQEEAVRPLLQEELLAASLLEKDWQWDLAEAEYRGVVHDDEAWPDSRYQLARFLYERSMVIERAAGNPKLQEAVWLWRTNLTKWLRETEPETWAMTQSDLGNALARQGKRAAGAESRNLLGEAVTAYRAALEVYTRAQFPLGWARTQGNLGLALSDRAERMEGAESRRLLGEAVTAYRGALEVRTRDELPLAWAKTQNNLGDALVEQGKRAEGRRACACWVRR